ncbi:MAG: hypothetical protein EXS03_01955 [Phycisphaerales bacterium]|nr:hypothetical protein [Phycisphaerales bacterium]
MDTPMMIRRVSFGLCAAACALAMIACTRTATVPRLDIGDGVAVVSGSFGARVEVEAQVAARIGWLEQLVCKAGTREHESLLAVEVPPRMIHAAMLAAGFQPGAPGRWMETQPTAAGGAPGLVLERPHGDRLALRVKWADSSGDHEEPLARWVRRESGDDEDATDESFPEDHFVFAGSLVRPNPPSLGKGEHYVADFTGSVVGLVTFGDEVIAFDEVIPDRVDVAVPQWAAWTQRIPSEGTRVVLVIQRAH